eukprot:9191490-Alexandrium_andersonii.AAC.1
MRARAGGGGEGSLLPARTLSRDLDPVLSPSLRVLWCWWAGGAVPSMKRPGLMEPPARMLMPGLAGWLGW